MVASTTDKSAERWLPIFPGEEPNVEQIKEWFKEATPLVHTRGYDYDIRGETPPALLPFTIVQSVDGMAELTATEAGGAAAAMKHNMSRSRNTDQEEEQNGRRSQ